MSVIEKLHDLHMQATTERSHYYVASCCRDALAEIAQLRAALEEIKEKGATMKNGGAWAAGLAHLCLATLKD
jgi:hypothetical protein